MGKFQRLVHLGLSPALMLLVVSVTVFVSLDEHNTCKPLNHTTMIKVRFETERLQCADSRDGDDYGVAEPGDVTMAPTFETSHTPATESPTKEPTKKPTPKPTRAPGEPVVPTNAPTNYPTYESDADITLHTGEFLESGANPYLSKHAVFQIGEEGRLSFEYFDEEDAIGDSLENCTLVDAEDAGHQISVACSINKNDLLVLEGVGAVQEEFPYKSWHIVANGVNVVEWAKFGKVFMCAGERNVAMPIEFDLAANSYFEKYTPRIFHTRFSRALNENDLLPYEWSNSQDMQSEASAVCYSLALNYLEANPDVPYIGLVVSSSPEVSLADWYPESINSYSKEIAYDNGFRQTEGSEIEGFLFYYGENFYSSSDISNFEDRFFNRFFIRYMRGAHPKTKIMIVGHDVQDATKASPATTARNAYQNQVQKSGDANMHYVSVFDLPDPYFRTNDMVGECDEALEQSRPWFLRGWCESGGSLSYGERLGTPRMKAIIGYRAFATAFQNVPTPWPLSVDKTAASNTDDGFTLVAVKFSHPVAFNVSLSNRQPKSQVFHWNRYDGRNVFGYTESSVPYTHGDITVSEDGLTLFLKRTTGGTVGINHVSYAQTNFPCCNVVDDEENALDEELVCEPMSCGLVSAENQYIPVEPFRFNNVF